MIRIDVENIQLKVNSISVPKFDKIHEFKDAPEGFEPWNSNLSPSALYNCSLTRRKQMKLKTPEVKWISIKRWTSVTPSGITLPAGVFLSVKRKETFIPTPVPHFEDKEYTLMMFKYGNVWSMKGPDDPITEEWLFSEENGMTILEALMRKDAAHPVIGYFHDVHEYMIKFPEEIGVHNKRKKVTRV